LKQIDVSSVYIYLFDATVLSIEEVKEDLSKFPEEIHQIVVANKADLLSKEQSETLNNSDLDLVCISAKQNQSIDALKDSLLKVINHHSLSEGDTIVSNARHYDALIKTVESLDKTKEGLDTGVTADFIAMDIRQAMFHLGTITGDISTDDLLGNIFSKFCIGK
jgi:tRNA modification GTPase